MTESINDFLAQIEEMIFWLKIIFYLVLTVIVVWLIGLIRRSAGLDSSSIELKRIRRILEEDRKEKLLKYKNNDG